MVNVKLTMIKLGIKDKKFAKMSQKLVTAKGKLRKTYDRQTGQSFISNLTAKLSEESHMNCFWYVRELIKVGGFFWCKYSTGFCGKQRYFT